MSSSLRFRPGVLSKDQIRGLIQEKAILNLKEEDVKDGSSFDLSLSEEYWKVDASIKPMEEESFSVALSGRQRKKVTRGGIRLKKGEIYIFKAQETLNLKDYKKIYGQATGKSSIGRLDILVRVIADEAPCYDRVPAHYSGDLYLEIIPITFDVKVCVGFPISQLRLFMGKPELTKISEEEIEEIYEKDFLRDAKGKALDSFDPTLRVNLEADPIFKEKLGEEICAFKAIKKKTDREPIDLASYHNERKKISPKNYWKPMPPEEGNSLTLEQEEFYILRSRERLNLPDDMAVGCEAVKEELGELRVHYAGFAHPWFGRNRPDNFGTPLIFEIRGHNFNTKLRNEEALATLEFYRMSEPVDKPDVGEYDKQELKLSKYFEEWK